jgi:arsenate reductase-like glutaredoxin family protein
MENSMSTKKIDWRYHRQACNTCKKSQAFIDAQGIKIKDELDARKCRIDGSAALEILSKIDRLIVAKGKGFVDIDLKNDPPNDDVLKKMLMGPTGNLRAPSIRIGKKMLVGFNDEMYRKFC